MYSIVFPSALILQPIVLVLSLRGWVYSQAELSEWDESRYLECIFCIDYDDYQKLSLFGCVPNGTPSCRGNACYMRQHKIPNYFLYTSGCLNLTRPQFNNIAESISSTGTKELSGQTQLCEISSTINTCLCSNRNTCNNVSSMEKFSEHPWPIFSGIHFNELAHFRYFLPNDPILKTGAERDEKATTGYAVNKELSPPSAASHLALYPTTGMGIVLAISLMLSTLSDAIIT